MGREFTGTGQLMDREFLNSGAIVAMISQFHIGNRIVGGPQIDADDKVAFRSQNYPLSAWTVATGAMPTRPRDEAGLPELGQKRLLDLNFCGSDEIRVFRL